MNNTYKDLGLSQQPTFSPKGDACGSMKIYLSNHWKVNCIVGILIILAMIISTAVVCIWMPDEENYILVVCTFLFAALFCYLMIKSARLIRYVTKENQTLVMYSFAKKKIASLRLDSDIYYEIVPLIEGAFAKRDFIILSNSTFESFRKHKASGLAQVCKTIEERGNQIIMPYSDRYISGLTDIPAWHKIG